MPTAALNGTFQQRHRNNALPEKSVGIHVPGTPEIGRCSLLSAGRNDIMLIAVNTRMLLKDRMEGIGYFTFECFKRITRLHPEYEFVFVFDRPYDPEFVFSDNITPVSVFPPARHPFLWYAWYEFSLPGLFRKIKPDLFVSNDGYVSLKAKVKTLAVIHDINFEHFRDDIPFFFRQYYRHFFPKYARRATRIATVSEYSREDIAKTYGVPAEKIDVVYNGAGDGFHPATQENIRQVRENLTGGTPFFLFIGAIHQRKNIARLLQAYDRFRSSEIHNHKLVLAGNRRWWTEEMEQAYAGMHYKDDVIFTGRISDERLQEITGAAFALVYVSVFEGFGIPVVEAFRSGIPVITSSVSSMPEIAGDAALLTDPYSIDSIVTAMHTMASDEKLRKELTNKGYQRASLFTWDRTAGLLWECMERTLHSK